MFKKILQLPSIVWVILFILGILAVMGSMIAFTVLIGTVPGFASAIFLIPGLLYVFTPELKSTTGKIDPIARAVCVGFFALMGMAIDQTGNIVYNYPFRYLCPADTVLNRTVDVTHPLPGRTDMTQDFRCEDSSGKVVYRIGMGQMIGVRFFEYLILAYLLIGLKSIKQMVGKSSAKITTQTE